MSDKQSINASSPFSYIFPLLVYGTADFGTGKPDQLSAAISMGYRFVDTGNNDPYDEASAGATLSAMVGDEVNTAPGPTLIDPVSTTTLQRNQIIIQAKYSPPTFFRNKKPPYDPADIIPLQVIKSFQATLLNLRVSYIDVYFLHRPFRSEGYTFAAWEAMEEIVRRGGARYLGISQVSLEFLQDLVQKADIPPRFVQNHCCSTNGYDRDVRAYCRDHGIVYQCFGLLAEVTKPTSIERVPTMGEASKLVTFLIDARRAGEQLCVLDGSRDLIHMRQNRKAMETVQNGDIYQEVPVATNFSL